MGSTAGDQAEYRRFDSYITPAVGLASHITPAVALASHIDLEPLA